MYLVGVKVTEEEHEQDDNEQNQELSREEIEAVQLAEQGQIERAIQIQTRLIECRPECASLYNNRLELNQRFMVKIDLMCILWLELKCTFLIISSILH